MSMLAADDDDDAHKLRSVRSPASRSPAASPPSCALTHSQARILFVYAKLNSGVRYVQGMNEILCPLWWVLATAPEPLGDRASSTAPPAAAAGAGPPSTPGKPSSIDHPPLTPASAAASASFSSPGAGSGADRSAAMAEKREQMLDAEADTFFCFMALMSEIRELFIAAHDNGG